MASSPIIVESFDGFILFKVPVAASIRPISPTVSRQRARDLIAKIFVAIRESEEQEDAMWKALT